MLASDTAKVTTATLLRQKALTSHHDREFQRSFKAVSKEFQRAAVAKLLNACKFGQSTRTKNVRLAQAGQSGTWRIMANGVPWHQSWFTKRAICFCPSWNAALSLEANSYSTFAICKMDLDCFDISFPFKEKHTDTKQNRKASPQSDLHGTRAKGLCPKSKLKTRCNKLQAIDSIKMFKHVQINIIPRLSNQSLWIKQGVPLLVARLQNKVRLCQWLSNPPFLQLRALFAFHAHYICTRPCHPPLPPTPMGWVPYTGPIWDLPPPPPCGVVGVWHCPPPPCGVVGVWYGMLGMYGVYGRSGMACLESMVRLVCMVGMVCMVWVVGIVWMVGMVCKSVGYGMFDMTVCMVCMVCMVTMMGMEYFLCKVGVVCMACMFAIVCMVGVRRCGNYISYVWYVWYVWKIW